MAGPIFQDRCLKPLGHPSKLSSFTALPSALRPAESAFATGLRPEASAFLYGGTDRRVNFRCAATHSPASNARSHDKARAAGFLRSRLFLATGLDIGAGRAAAGEAREVFERGRLAGDKRLDFVPAAIAGESRKPGVRRRMREEGAKAHPL